MLSVVADEQARVELTTDLDELFREGARRMLAVVLEAEVQAYIAAHAELTDEHGHRLVVRNGHAPARTLATGVGQVEVVRPRVDDRRLDSATGERVQLSASVITRLTGQWQAEREAFLARDLSDRDYVDCWADGIHFNICLEDGRLCCLVIVGVRADGTKELVAVADGERESTDAWAELLRDCRRRGMGAPVVMVGDGALGLWRALREVFPATREQRCWVHKVANVLNALPKSVQAGARRGLHEIAQAEDRAHAELAIEALVSDYGARWPKAVAKITDDREALLCFFDFPAEHWPHLRITNPIESTFSPVRARTRVTKGPGSKQAGLAMVFKLLHAAEGRWRAVNGPHLVALVRAGARFEKGRLVERPAEPDREVAAWP
jgi:putative transposase